MDYELIAKEVLNEEANALLNAANSLDGSISKAVRLILATKGKLIITGVGKSGHIGSKIAATLASTGTPSFFIHPTEALHGDLGMIGKEDAILAISYSGESEELIKILPHIKRRDIKIISMSKSSKSSLARLSDVHILIGIEKEACPLNSAPTSSTTLTLALADALGVCLMKARHFSKKDFAAFHPGGALGKRLFVKVSDIMRKNPPCISEDATLKDAISVMSEGKLGNVLIIKPNGLLAGVLSDGDLRRALEDENFSLMRKALDFACKNPKSIDDDNLLAIDALHLIEEYKIQLLIILNQGKIAGALHIHDLMQLGIK